MKTKLLVAVAIVVALIIAFAVRVTQQIGERRATLTALSAQRDQLRQRAEQWEARLPAAKAGLIAPAEISAASSVESNGAKGTAGVVAGGNQVNPGTPGRRLSAMTLIANDPGKLAEYSKNLRDSLALDYGPHFKAVGLSPEQIEKFKDVEVALEQAKMDLQAAIENQGLDPNSVECKKLWADYNDSRVKKKAEVLGDLTGRYIDYFRSQNVREYARYLAGTGLITGELVTAAQVDRAGDILAANANRSKSTDSYPGWTNRSTINWPAASEQLKTVLSPNQIEIVRLQIEHHKIQDKVNERTKVLTAQFKGQPPQK